MLKKPRDPAASTGKDEYWPLNVMIATHYDKDHLNGLTSLLLKAALYDDVMIFDPLYDNVMIFDQGWPLGRLNDPNYTNYLRAINGMNTNGKVLNGVSGRTRVTRDVNATGRDLKLTDLPYVLQIKNPAVPDPDKGQKLDQSARWLIDGGPAEILWYGNAGGPQAGAPQMECIAANAYIRTPGGGVSGDTGSNGADPSNERSLAFVVTFDNFRYYIGGDIESAQEALIAGYLNNAGSNSTGSSNAVSDPPGNAAGRVLAFKTSHHGANTATSRAFVNQLRPMAAFISCGTANKYPQPHPAQETINVLDGYPDKDADPKKEIPPDYPPNRPVLQFLTGYQSASKSSQTGQWELQSRGGYASITAGDPEDPVIGSAGGAPVLSAANPRVRGHILITVSAGQAGHDVGGELFAVVKTAAAAAATATGLVGQMDRNAAPVAAAVAAEKVVSPGLIYAAEGFLKSAGYTASTVLAAVDHNALLTLLKGIYAQHGADAGAAAQAVTRAAMLAGVPAGPAAGAGAAVGCAFGYGYPPEGGDSADAVNAVGAALMAAGLAPGAPGIIAAEMAAYAAAETAIETSLFSVTCYYRPDSAVMTFVCG